MRIRFCVSLHNYELRHCWQVSSLIQQHGEWLPDILLDVAVVAGEENPLRFPAGRLTPRLTLEYFPTDRETFAKRGLVRNEQLLRAMGDDWIFYADCDRVFHPDFFSVLGEKLHKELAKSEKVISYIRRASTELEPTEKLVQLVRGPLHYNAWDIVSRLPREWEMNIRMATGGMQLCRPGVVHRKGGGYYCPPDKCPDRHMFKGGQRARSDLYFRRMMGGCEMLSLPLAVHLEHNRDKEAGKHLETQR